MQGNTLVKKRHNVKDAYNKWGILFAVILAFTTCQREKEPSPPVSVTGISLEKNSLNLTIYSSLQIRLAFKPADATNKNVTWSSSAPDVVSVADDGTITALKYTDPANGTGKAVISVTTDDGGFTASCTVTATMAAQENIMDLPPLKRTFKDYFMMGNIFDPGDVPDAEPYTINKPWLTYHYNTLTPQNQMKPQYLCGAERGQYNEANIATAKRMIAAALAQGIKVQGHCLLWHSQIPAWQSALRTSSDTKEQVLTYLREYITDIVTEFKGSLYAWDVLNEVFRDGVGSGSDWKTNAMRNGTGDGNPWYMKLGADFVYEGFLAARLADPDIILYYNDYNLDQAGKAAMVHNMVRDVNAQYASQHPEANGRKLIEGIGMQSHHNADVTAAQIKASLDLFRPLGVKISISELDVLAQSYSDYDARKAVTIPALLNQANQYGEFFKVFLDNADIIERVTFWGVSDGASWRSSTTIQNDPNSPWRGLPLPFAGEREGWTLIPESIKAKPAYYKIIEALEEK